jgi:hypothetical protein
MPLFRLRSVFSPSPTFLALLLSTTVGAAAPAFAADMVLTLNTDRVQEDTQAPAFDLAVTRFAGMASGSYYWPEGLVAEQLIEGLSSAMHRKAQALPGDLQLLSSYRRPYGGSERAAVLVDSRSGDVLAAALVHPCVRQRLVCHRLPGRPARGAVGVLAPRLRPRQGAAADCMEHGRCPKTTAGRQGRKDRQDRIHHAGCRAHRRTPVERPKGFSADVPLYPKAQIYRTGQDALSDAKAKRVLRLQTTDSMEKVLAFYKQLSPPLRRWSRAWTSARAMSLAAARAWPFPSA